MDIKYYNRDSGAVEVEKVYGDKLVGWLYGSSLGSGLSHVLCKAPLSKLYGRFQDTAFSTRKIDGFIDSFNIDMDEFVVPASGSYASFNDFFIREFKDGARPFESNKFIMPAFAEARYFGFPSVQEGQTFPVKGSYLSSDALLGDSRWAGRFKGGPLLIARLCPVDYHRFHWPDSGVALDSYRVKGDLHSVNPLALACKPDVLATNERHVTILKSENFGHIAVIEVGAICVGKIVQTDNRRDVKRGDEKGYFLFGGSTVIVMGEQGRWVPQADICSNSTQGIETLVKLGDGVAYKTAIEVKS